MRSAATFVSLLNNFQLLGRNFLIRPLAFCFMLVLSLMISGCQQKDAADAAPKGDPSQKASGKGRKGPGGGAVPVMVANATRRDVPVEVEVIGNVEASSVVMIKPQVSGELVRVLFREGDFVRKGDPLFEIDRRSLEAQIQQAQANLSRSEAQARLAEANLGRSRAQGDYLRDQAKRYAQLTQEGVISKEQNDQAISSAKAQDEMVLADQAAIESAKADISANRALVENLKVQLSFTYIKSPISGRTGTLLVRQGNIVSANSTDLVQINQMEPVFVSFAVPEAQLKGVATQFRRDNIPVFAVPQDGGETKQGSLTFFENTVDVSTGTIRMRGTFLNPDHKLWPGEFVRVRMRIGSNVNAVVIPNQALQTGQDGQFVYVVKQDRSVEARPVTVSSRSGEDIVIATGLTSGETVVTEGQIRLVPGMQVQIRENRPADGQKGSAVEKKKTGSNS